MHVAIPRKQAVSCLESETRLRFLALWKNPSRGPLLSPIQQPTANSTQTRFPLEALTRSPATLT